LHSEQALLTFPPTHHPQPEARLQVVWLEKSLQAARTCCEEERRRDAVMRREEIESIFFFFFEKVSFFEGKFLSNGCWTFTHFLKTKNDEEIQR
jgi:hypothetical protein